MAQHKLINLEDMKKIIDNNSTTPVTIVDARTAQWDDGRRIPGALSLPADSAPELYGHIVPKKTQPLIVYCGGGQCPAARILAERLMAAGFSDVREYAGGIKEWSDENNYPIEMALKNTAQDCESSCQI